MTIKEVGISLLLFLLNAQAETFEFYQNNGGLVTAIAGKRFCLLAGDTRMMDGGYQIYSRNLMRLWGIGATTTTLALPEIGEEVRSKITPSIVIGTSGCSSDCTALQKDILYQVKAFDDENYNVLGTPNVAQLLSQTLYSRRGTPYYCFCVVGGISQENGAVYVYDAIGSMEQVAVGTAGTGRELLQPILDRLFVSSSEKDKLVDCSAEDAIKNVIQAYHAVAEREIGVGDSLVLCLLEQEDVIEKSSSQEKITSATENGTPCRIIRVPLKQH